jgi:hypothetical protein
VWPSRSPTGLRDKCPRTSAGSGRTLETRSFGSAPLARTRLRYIMGPQSRRKHRSQIILFVSSCREGICRRDSGKRQPILLILRPPLRLPGRICCVANPCFTSFDISNCELMESAKKKSVKKCAPGFRPRSSEEWVSRFLFQIFGYVLRRNGCPDFSTSEEGVSRFFSQIFSSKKWVSTQVVHSSCPSSCRTVPNEVTWMLRANLYFAACFALARPGSKAL